MSEEVAQLETPQGGKAVERELKIFRLWFSLATFLLAAVAFIIGFPALEDAGRKVGLGSLAFGLPFAIDLGMVTLLLWSMWNRGSLKAWWPPLVPAVLLLLLSSWLQYIHAVGLISATATEAERWGLLILAASLPLLLALSAGVFEAVTFAPLLERAKRHALVEQARREAEDEVWSIELEERKRRVELEATLKRSRLEIESKTQLRVLEAEAEAAARSLRAPKSAARVAPVPAPKKQILPPVRELPRNIETEVDAKPTPPEVKEASPAVSTAVMEAVKALRSGELSQRAAAEKFGVPRSTLRRQMEELERKGL